MESSIGQKKQHVHDHLASEDTCTNVRVDFGEMNFTTLRNTTVCHDKHTEQTHTHTHTHTHTYVASGNARVGVDEHAALTCKKMAPPWWLNPAGQTAQLVLVSR